LRMRSPRYLKRLLRLSTMPTLGSKQSSRSGWRTNPRKTTTASVDCWIHQKEMVKLSQRCHQRGPLSLIPSSLWRLQPLGTAVQHGHNAHLLSRVSITRASVGVVGHLVRCPPWTVGSASRQTVPSVGQGPCSAAALSPRVRIEQGMAAKEGSCPKHIQYTELLRKPVSVEAVQVVLPTLAMVRAQITSRRQVQHHHAQHSVATTTPTAPSPMTGTHSQT
jgi:hypothetical protein